MGKKYGFRRKGAINVEINIELDITRDLNAAIFKIRSKHYQQGMVFLYAAYKMLGKLKGLEAGEPGKQKYMETKEINKIIQDVKIAIDYLENSIKGNIDTKVIHDKGVPLLRNALKELRILKNMELKWG